MHIVATLLLFCSFVISAAGGQPDRSWLAEGFPTEFSDEVVLELLLGKSPGYVTKFVSADVIVSSRKVLSYGKHSSSPGLLSPFQEAIVLCDAEIGDGVRTRYLMYLVRSLRANEIAALRIWHLSGITPKVGIYQDVNMDTVARFIQGTNFGLNECDPNMKLQMICIEDMSLVSFESLLKNIPADDIRRARLREHDDSYMKDVEEYGGHVGKDRQTEKIENSHSPGAEGQDKSR